MLVERSERDSMVQSPRAVGIDHDEVAEVPVKYVIGADGAKSTVRRFVDLKLEGDAYEEPWLGFGHVPADLAE